MDSYIRDVTVINLRKVCGGVLTPLVFITSSVAHNICGRIRMDLVYYHASTVVRTSNDGSGVTNVKSLAVSRGSL